MNVNVIRAIFRRNFVAYFSNPTGYVFICMFVLLSGFAAFWPNEFFNANLANLDQLNRYLPYIMLVFIPAITMGIWAEERRQGTDELLLTIPAGDFDVVIGKYLAAVAIFSVSLLFSLSNIVVLMLLGSPDIGLLLSNYVGYWVMGAAMISIGMVASFLTGNLTVGFILGAAFNAPLAFATSADVVAGQESARFISRWSLSAQFVDFGRGVISLASVIYFFTIAAMMLYVSMVLISRRHWAGAHQRNVLATHYTIRALAFLGVLIGTNLFLTNHDLRLDVTAERLSSLAEKTRQLVGELDPKRPVVIDAFVSAQVPEAYVQTRLNLLSALREFDALGGDAVRVRVHRTQLYSEEAALAEQHDIRAQEVQSRTRGAFSVDEIYMGLVISSGLETVRIPFVDRGVPIEYELIRSIATVAQQERKKVGVLATDAKLYGSFDMQTMTPMRNEMIIDELSKQYEVVQVSADSPIIERYDVLLAAQPSSLSPEQMNNFVDAVRNGQPTAIFEDPFPYMVGSVPGTLAPKQPPRGGMMGMQPPGSIEKGNINQLWNLLGIDFNGAQVVWQDYNPYRRIREMPPEFVFVGINCGAREPFNAESSISSGLQLVLFPFPGSLRRQNVSDLKFTPLVRTSDKTGYVLYDDILLQSPFGFGPTGLNPHRRHAPTRDPYIIGAHIHGRLNTETLQMAAQDEAVESSESESEPQADGDDQTIEAIEPPEDEGEIGQEPEDSEPPEINVVLVADIDVLYSAFFALRSRGTDPDDPFNQPMDNVTFVLNVLDLLAQDDRFIEIRKRQPKHRTLSTIEDWTTEAKNSAATARDEFIAEFDTERSKEQSKLDERVSEIEKRTDLDTLQKANMVEIARVSGEKRLQARTKRLEQERDKKIEQEDRNLELSIRSLQNWCKVWAVIVPPIPPLVVGVLIFFRRRAREREGVSRARFR